MPTDIDARRFYRVALQRLEEGELLVDRLRRYNAAVYLTGYATECILKALLITVTPAAEREEVARSFRGSLGHDLLWLRRRLAARSVSLPPPEARELAYVSSWSVNLRYEPGAGVEEDARRFIDATRIIVRWADGRL